MRSFIFHWQGYGKTDSCQDLLEISLLGFYQKRQMGIVDAYLLDSNAPLIKTVLYIFQSPSLPLFVLNRIFYASFREATQPKLAAVADAAGFFSAIVAAMGKLQRRSELRSQ